MIKKLLSLIVLNLFFISSVYASSNLSAKIEIENNVASINLSNVPNDITSIQIDIKDENKNSNVKFEPSNKNFSYSSLIKQENSNYTMLSILIDNKDNTLTENGNLSVGKLTFSNSPKLNSEISVELSNIDNNIIGSKETISADIIIRNSNNNGNDSGDNGNNNSGSEDSNSQGGSSNSGNTNNSSSGNSGGSSTSITTTKPESENNKPQEPVEENNKFDVNKEYPVIKSVNFLDTNSHWANESITFLAERGIIDGFSDSQFLPNNSIKRSEFVKLLAKMDNIDESQYKTNTFNDVSDTAWFNPYVAWAEKTGITSGISPNQFAPNENISREQMAVMIKRFSDYKKFSLNEVKEKIEFKDSSDISNYALDAISSVQKAGIINGLGDQTFKPKSNATRAESAKMLHYLIISQ